MKELKSIFATALYSKLRDKVYGKVTVYINDEESIVVKIDCYDDIRFKTTIDNFYEKIYYGYSAEYAAYEVLKEYKAFVNKTYFK